MYRNPDYTMTVEVCEDCYVVSYNGQDSIEPDTEPKPWSIWLNDSKIHRFMIDDLSTVLCEKCNKDGDGGYYDCDYCYGDGYIMTSHFRRYNCDGCGSLPGDRYKMAVSVWEKT